MMPSAARIVQLLRKAATAPPNVVFERVAQEVTKTKERVVWAVREPDLSTKKIVRWAGGHSLDDAWTLVASAPGVTRRSFPTLANVPELAQAAEPVIARADEALRHRVRIFGFCGDLGSEIDWSRDYKSGYRWAPGYGPGIDYTLPELPCDVKFPWEISRFQWVLPLGQAYQLTGADNYAAEARNLIERWWVTNRHGWTVNWACTMDVALRVTSWLALVRLCADAPSWRSPNFRRRMLSSIALHGRFIRAHLEQSVVNGNHYTADILGLFLVSLCWPASKAAREWRTFAWNALVRECLLQFEETGENIEASTGYHRLVLEMFSIAFVAARNAGYSIPPAVCARLLAAAEYVEDYTRPDRLAPLHGDADDARVLPFGSTDIRSHLHAAWLARFAVTGEAVPVNPDDDLWWIAECRSRTCEPALPKQEARTAIRHSSICLRAAASHAFIDAGEVGLKGRGGHGHNDCLSFELTLRGESLITERGCYCYTSDVVQRQLYRSTESHNTPQVDEEEINRFVSPTALWTLSDDSRVKRELLTDDARLTVVRVTHDGYSRREAGAMTSRTFAMPKDGEWFAWLDHIEGKHPFHVVSRLHFDPRVRVSRTQGGWALRAQKSLYTVRSFGDDCSSRIEETSVAPSYGFAIASTRAVWTWRPTRVVSAAFIIAPAERNCSEIAHELLRAAPDLSRALGAS